MFALRRMMRGFMQLKEVGGVLDGFHVGLGQAAVGRSGVQGRLGRGVLAGFTPHVRQVAAEVGQGLDNRKDFFRLVGNQAFNVPGVDAGKGGFQHFQSGGKARFRGASFVRVFVNKVDLPGILGACRFQPLLTRQPFPVRPFAVSRALGEVHYNVRSDIINAAAGWLAEVLNEQLLAAVYRFNAAAAEEEAAWPYYDPSSKAVNDPTKAAERVRILLESGIPLVKNWVHEVTETPQPGDDDEVYTRPDPSGQLSPALVAKALDGMPAASRDYFLAAIQSAASTL